MRKAAEDTADEHPEHRYALHYDSIKRGVQEASKIRVSEIQEDYPWVHRVLSPLGGKVVPCEFDEIAERWRDEGVLERLTEEAEQNEVKLPPRHVDQGPDGVRLDLESLGLFLRLSDDRVNIPDVFRVGYGLGRRGGGEADTVTGGRWQGLARLGEAWTRRATSNFVIVSFSLCGGCWCRGSGGGTCGRLRMRMRRQSVP